ncbi:MAG TPA: uracil permease [Holophaga sp.]|nr:uracil permease [Holophaga sp.]HPS67646.1 uracil permease [Holophaga sp.]
MAATAQREIIQVEQKVPILKGIPLSLQHLFAMFGASILVPILFNTWAGKMVIDPALVLMMNGIGTLIYLFICKGKAPAFLGSSFAFLSPTAVCIATATKAGLDPQIGFQRAVGGFFIAGLAFALVSLVIRFAGRRWISIVLPPAAMGPIVALIGLELAPVAVGMSFFKGGSMASGEIVGSCVLISLFTLAVVIVGSVVFRGFLAAIPILIGVIAGYILSVILGVVDFSAVTGAQFLTIPRPVLPIFDWASILIVLPAALVVISEHIGHLFVTSNIVGRNLLKEPGLHNSLLGDGLSTMISGLTGSCPTTTYGENMGVMAITRVYSVWVIGGAAVISIFIAFFGHVSGAIRTLPTPVIGGVSMMLFGVIAASGLRMLIEAKVDYSKSRNLLLSAVVFVVGISGVPINIGGTQLKGMVLATLVAIVLSLVFYLFEQLGWSNEEPDVVHDEGAEETI